MPVTQYYTREYTDDRTTGTSELLQFLSYSKQTARAVTQNRQLSTVEIATQTKASENGLRKTRNLVKPQRAVNELPVFDARQEQQHQRTNN